jgi:hypothetical protein
VDFSLSGEYAKLATFPAAKAWANGSSEVTDQDRGLAHEAAPVGMANQQYRADLKTTKVPVNVLSPGPIQTPGLVFANHDVKSQLKSVVPLGPRWDA